MPPVDSIEWVNYIGRTTVMAVLWYLGFDIVFNRREARDRYQAPANPVLFFTEQGAERLRSLGHEPPEPLELQLSLAWRPLWKRERRWIAWVAPGTIAALGAGTIGLDMVAVPPPRTVVVLEEWKEYKPKPPRRGRTVRVTLLRPALRPGLA